MRITRRHEESGLRTVFEAHDAGLATDLWFEGRYTEDPFADTGETRVLGLIIYFSAVGPFYIHPDDGDGQRTYICKYGSHNRG